MEQELHGRNRKKMLVALGSNAASQMGDARSTVLAALETLGERYGTFSTSGLYQTPAFPPGSGPDFVNAACAFDTGETPQDVLAHLHQIEADFGRTRTKRWGQRTLDLDLIASGQTIAPDRATFDHWRSLSPDAQQIDAPETLILPHPRLQDRPFVLIPLADVAPDWVHPTLGQTVTQMIAVYPQAARAEIKPL